MKIMLIIASAVMIAGCASPVYQKEGANGTHRVGYSEAKITGNSYRVRYLGKDSLNAYSGFMRRSSELTLENGFKYFTSKDAGGTKEDNAVTGMIGGAMVDMGLPKYEATIVMSKTKSEGAIDADEYLKTNPLPVVEVRKPASNNLK